MTRILLGLLIGWGASAAFADRATGPGSGTICVTDCPDVFIRAGGKSDSGWDHPIIVDDRGYVICSKEQPK